MGDHLQAEAQASLEELELLVFGRTLVDKTLERKLLWAEEGFTAHLVARLAREPVVLH